MRRLIFQLHRPGSNLLLVASVGLLILVAATFPIPSVGSQGLNSPDEVLGASDDTVMPPAGLTLTVNSLGDAADAVLGNGLCDTDVSTPGDQCTLRAALLEANSVSGADTINFSVTGTINLTGGLPSVLAFITINGPGSSLLTVRRDTGGDYNIFLVNGAAITISGLTVSNGRAPDGLAVSGSGGQGVSGGGIYNIGDLTLRDVVVTGNRAGNGGTGATTNSGFGGSGGGIYSSGLLTMTKVTVSNNAAGNGATDSGGSGGRGGGIYFSGSTLRMTDCTVSGNAAGNGVAGPSGSSSGEGGGGGGIEAENGSLILTNVVINGNHAGDGAQTTASTGGHGGGMLTFPGVLTTMTNCTVSNNNTGQGGTGFSPQGGLGGGIDNFGVMTMIGCAVTGNFTKGPSEGGGGSGGGIFNNHILTMTNCTVSGNNAHLDKGRGGGIYNNSATVSLTNCTITGNAAISCCGFQNGQGIHSAGTANVRNTIIAGNGNGNVPDLTGDFNSQGHNLIGKATLGSNHGSNGDQTGFVNGNNGDQVGTLADPLDSLLGPLANNGAQTLTHALLSGSPALDSGDNSFVVNPPFTGPPFNDQRGSGFNRIVDGPDADATATVDIGAFEKQAVFPNLSDASTNEDTPVVVAFDVDDSGSVTGVAATSSNTTLVPNNSANLSVTSGGSTWVLTINPVANLSGTSDITVTVNRPGVSLSRTFTLTVNPVNDAPTFIKGPDQSVSENDPTQTVNNWATSISPGPADESGQTVAFQIVSNTNPGLFTVGPAISSTGTLTYTPTPGASGSAAIVVVLSDNGGTANGGTNLSSTQTFTINVFEGGTVQFNSFSYFFSENSGNAVITVSRSGGSAGEARINYATTASLSAPDFRATADADYTPASGTLIFPNGVTSQTFSVKIINDGFDENTETLNLILTNPSGSGSLGVPSNATVSISDDDPRPTITINDAQVLEGNSGTSNIVFTVTLSGATALPVSASFGTVNSSAFAPSDYVALNGNLTFNPGEATKTISVTVNGDTVNELNEAFFVRFNSSTNADIIRFMGVGTILNDDTPRVQFSSASYSVTEAGGSTAITVQRLGDTAGTTTVGYASNDHSNPADFIPCTSPGPGFASSRCDFTTAVGTLRFAPGETSKTFNVLVSQDNYVEGSETVLLTLSNPSGGAVVGTPATAMLTITDDSTEPANNPIDTSIEFVRSQYHDFLNREPDGPGLAFWTDNIDKCNDQARRPTGQTAAQCIDKQRESTAVAFFSSPEFQMTGGFVYRLYKGSLTGSPNYDGGSAGRFPTSLEFMRDVSQVSEGIVVSNQISGAVVEANRNRLAAEFVQRPEFVAKYGALNNTLYVLELFNTTGIVATTAEKQTLIDAMSNGTETKASVLRKIVDGTVVLSEGNVQFTTTYGEAFYNQELRRVFVYMEYIGYLRRNPDAAGFVFWLGKLNFYNGDPFQAEMVRSFILAPEYRQRFGQ